ncbi:MAG: PLP-dependent aminotransferase family protein [bacterium]|nr:PLP-dependent aminotransferase family protein [bacterium]
MLVLNLDRKSSEPLFKQVFTQLKVLMDTAVLKPGFRMPSTRLLSEKLGVNRSTIYKAYQELWALGYTESRPGSYSYVRKRKPSVTRPKEVKKNTGDVFTTEAADKVYQFFRRTRGQILHGKKDGLINMSEFLPDPRLLPVEEFRKSLNTVLKEQGAKLLKYSKIGGYMPLRKYIANRMQQHGMQVSPGEILITGGTQTSIDLLTKLLAAPGSRVLTEMPTYHAIFPLLTFYNAEIAGIPMDENGMDIGVLETELKKERPAYIYTIPNFHNPTGITLSHSRREQMLTLCEKYRVPLLEDAFEEEMKYFGKVPQSVKSMDTGQLVVYLGTFSKVLFPGIRIGWIAASREFIKRLAALKKYSDLSTNLPIQAALADFCQSGYYDLHLKRIHRIYRKRLQTVQKAVKTHLDIKGVTVSEPGGGYLMWVRLENLTVPEDELYRRLRELGVAVSPGSLYYNDHRPHSCFRVSISTLNEEEIETGFARIGQVLKKIASDDRGPRHAG